ncbi:TPA: hypothetical protein I8608_000333 [Morganella morganii]|jgi:hypothetical protein|uniref:DUF4761 domain-containing protein n=1 Tax=Morganella morganii TaxID=582 RepID=A0AAN5MCC9_MORMO|nr:DUF4761 family protein [Morganella morganii]EME4037975.1 hypothetical protein [Morganella morganii]MBT0356096.1 hypothetical protein [Morganella morganii subsp. morganii]HAT3807543.1 hypothetical protein [Morganella morganii]HDT0626489.1 hypothetical protein [Morganella morganii subsp. morganii]HDU8652847.1 hypothetical protein [Morganella morganii subsp. morganii]
MQQANYQLISYKSHCSIYRGFSVHKLPRNATRKITQYRVTLGDDSFGKFDALAEAIRFIDGLFKFKSRLNSR